MIPKIVSILPIVMMSYGSLDNKVEDFKNDLSFNISKSFYKTNFNNYLNNHISLSAIREEDIDLISNFKKGNSKKLIHMPFDNFVFENYSKNYFNRMQHK